MKKKLTHTKKLKAIVSLVAVIVVGTATVGSLIVHAATSPDLYLPTSAATYTVGDDVVLQVRENGNGAPINSAQFGIKYPTSLLQLASIDYSGGALTTNFSPSTQTAGEVLVTLADVSGSFTTDQLLATLHFTALAAGTAPLSFTAPCQSAATNDCTSLGSAGTTVAATYTGGSYTIQAATTTTPPPVTTTPPPVTTTTTPTTTSTATKATSTSITPKSSTSAITAPTGSQVQISTPATVEPATIQPDGVAKVQYYLNNKLVYTASDVPFAYHLDTTSLLNGSYTLRTVSYYDSGRTVSSTQILIVSNPFSFTQFRLLIAHYTALIIIVLAIILIALVLWLTRKRWQHGSSPRFGSSAGGPSAPNIQTPPSVFTPTTGTGFTSLTPQAVPVRTDE
jgi:hypothetical protein